MTTMQLLVRGAILFVFGVFFAVVLNLLQVYREIPVNPSKGDGMFSHYDSWWWVLPSCGMAATIIGLLYPCLDKTLGEPNNHKGEWSSVMRCVAVFVGINHASAKLDFTNNLHMSVILAAMSIGLWWLFDRSRSGFGLGVSIAVLATFVTQFLTYYGFLNYTKENFMFIKAWLSCIFFSGGVTMGIIGRQLATYNSEKTKMD